MISINQHKRECHDIYADTVHEYRELRDAQLEKICGGRSESSCGWFYIHGNTGRRKASRLNK